MNDSTSPSPAPPSGAPPPSAAPANTQGLARVLLIVLIATCLVGGTYALVAMVAALRDLGALAGLILGLVPVVALPGFLVVRAGLALKRRGQGPVVRRLVSIALILLTHLAVIGVVTEWVGRSSGDFFAASYLALEEVGGVPYISPMLKRAAKERNALPLPGDDATATGPDGGPLPGVDGGPAPHADGGPSPEKPSGGVTPPPAPVDAGAAGVTTQTAPPEANGALSPRQDGGARVLFAASTARDASGNPIVLTHSAYAKGGVQHRRFSLAPFRSDGSVRLVETSNDGFVVVVLSSSVVLVAAPETDLAKLASLAPRAKVNTADGGDAGTITAVRDVVVGPGGEIVAVVEVTKARGKPPTPTLVSTTVGGAVATVIRQRGDAVDDTADGPLSVYDFALRRGTGTDRFVLVETLAGQRPVRTKLTGKAFEMNPQRLLVGSTRAPAGLREVARTGTTVLGLENKSLQAFQDAVALADGRVLFDANFLDDGKNGWLFVATPGDAQAYAVAPKLFDAKAPWTTAAPRARSLAASEDFIALVARGATDGALVYGELTGGVTAIKSGASAIGIGPLKGTQWRVLRVHSVALADTGDYVIALATVRGDDGKERKALLHASAADLNAGVFAALIVEETGDAPISRLNFREDRRDALWMIAP